MRAFKNIKNIEKQDSIIKKHREWLKQYEGKFFSVAEYGKHKKTWKKDVEKYKDSNFKTEINCIQRLNNRTIIEFDDKNDEGEKQIEIIQKHIKEVIMKLKDLNIGFIRSSHKGNGDYIWVEFVRDMKDKEIKQFLNWVAPDGSEIDMNFASSKRVFPVLYAIHWKHSNNRELPIEYFEGEQIDYDKLGIEPIDRLKKSYRYETYIKEPGKVFTRRGQAEFFSDLHPMFYDKNKLWWLWNKKKYKWEMVDEVDVLNMINEATGMDIITSKTRNEILNALKQEGRKKIPKAIERTWVQFQNMIVDIKTGNEFEATPKYFVTNPIPYKRHNDKFIETPTIDRIFEEWVGKNYIQTLYEIISYCLIPSYPIHRLFCLIGEGCNGKGSFLRLLEKFVGIKNVTSTELDTLISSRFEITRLHKKLVCIMGETNFSELSKTSVIKKLTGQDMIGFEYKNKDPFEDYNYAKIIIATNNLPTTTDKTLGFYRRWCIIDFPNRFSEEKDILEDIPEEEYESLALKCCFILKDLLEKRKFHKEGSMEDRALKYEEKSDFLQKFIDEFVEEDAEGYITKRDFYRKLKDWCQENRHRALAENTLGKKMKEKGYESGKKYVDWMNEGKGGQVHAYLSVRWKN